MVSKVVLFDLNILFRWAAKEAVIKATGILELNSNVACVIFKITACLPLLCSYTAPELPMSPRHISVFKLPSGSPRARLHDASADAWWSKRSETCALRRSAEHSCPVIMLSLTHDGDYAAAVAFDE
jgi:phosphopantetheinyl transferase (holo-ACP synthase)